MNDALVELAACQVVKDRERRVPLTLAAPAKLTLSFEVLGVRGDGFHEIRAQIVTINLADELTFEAGCGLQVVDEVVGGFGLRDVPAGDANLVANALDMVGGKVGVRLVKHVPSGAGLGGGSADAAAVLRWDGYRSASVAARLGADVPFCLRGGSAKVTGIGETVRPAPFEERHFVLLLLPFGLRTANVYAAWDRLPDSQRHAAKNDPRPPNDLEQAAIKLEPKLALWHEIFAKAAGVEPRLAGSGSTLFIEGTRKSLKLDGRDYLVLKGAHAPLVEVSTLPAFGLSA